jgi:phosphotransferase system  glucose/maltose/N-acetylglucosamine-specific IIC component
MRLRVRALGMSVGIVWGLFVLLATLWLIWFAGPGPVFQVLKTLYPGYDVTYVGGLVGLFWGFVDGFIAGALVAWLYNKFHKALYKSEVTP